jgi:flagellar hook-basal body complex protein FliE
MIAPLSALAASPVGAPQPAAGGAATVGETSFADVLSQVAGEAMSTLHAGEAAAIAGMKGTASAQDVVQAVMSAEQTLHAAIAIRDKVVAAYQEISRMAI